MTDPSKPFLPFTDFVNAVQAAQHAEVAALPAAQVSGPDEFEKMREHVLKLYQGVDVPHSFQDESGQVFDCIPIEQQPAARAAEAPVIATPPELPGSSPESAIQPPTTASAAGTDAFGNARICPAGTVPMRRITPEEIARFQTLERFFRKSPVGRGIQPTLSPLQFGVQPTHKYAHAFQNVNNLGGHSFLSVWAPHVSDDQFSLSQHWYAASGAAGVQTVELGWQVYPQKYHHSKPALFVYWTADGYQNTGSYNLDDGDFVQTNSAWTLGGTLSPWSTVGGPINEIELACHLSGGNWWIYVNGAALGYYRGTQYGGGPLATFATTIDYGGETVGSGVWPPMGSGERSDAGNTHAASQRDIYYYPAPSGNPALPNLIGQQPSPLCYTISPGSAAPPWNRYFFYGGAGGSSC
ncbi:MAG: hypothetical protein JWP89_2282 [Schlesneria sp.]|nr:hypothetical protein [Schlesneria sp.]